MRAFLFWLCIVSICSVADPAMSADRGQADAEATKGLEAMRDADGDPHRGVDAAIAFGHALAIYRQLGDEESISEMQANIFWCKKRMNLEDLQAYIAHKGGSAANDFDAAKQVMEQQVPLAEADAYLERARRFQGEHADRHFEIAIRFSEIVERFPDSEAAKAANQVFAKEQSAYLSQVAKDRENEKEQLAQEINNIRATRFMQPPSALAGNSKVPDAPSQERAMAAIKGVYKDAYQGRRESQKRALARRLYAESDANHDDAAYCYIMLDESARLALESGDYEQMLTSVEKLGQSFSGFDVLARKKELLLHMRSEAVAAAILTLLSDPKDKRANLVAGKAFCFSIQRWDLGLPMLADGEDPDLRKAANMELANPAGAGEQRAVGDAWFDIGRHAGSAERTAIWTRAQYWYRTAQGGLGGVNRAQIDKRLEEIEDALPLVDPDWDHLSPKQWAKVKGKEFAVPAKVDRSNGGIALTPQYRVRAVPYPDDRNSMVFVVGNPGERQGPGVLSGNGPVWIVPTTARRGALDTAVLRVKFVEIDG